MSTSKPRTVKIDPNLPVKTLSETARAMNLTPQAVQQAEIRALAKLRHRASKAGMHVYLYS